MPDSSVANDNCGAPVKLLFCVAGSVLALILNRWPPLAFLAASTAAWALLKLDWKLMLKIYLFLALALLICLAGAAWLPKIGGGASPLSPGLSIRMAVLPCLRLLVSVNLTLILVLTTPMSALSRLAAALPLPDWLFIPLSVMLRFVATFLNELKMTREALLIRSRRSLIRVFLSRPWLLWRSFLVPMTFRALAGADDLAISVEMKGLARKALQWPRPPLLSNRDFTALALGLTVLAAVLLIQHFGGAEVARPGQ